MAWPIRKTETEDRPRFWTRYLCIFWRRAVFDTRGLKLKFRGWSGRLVEESGVGGISNLGLSSQARWRNDPLTHKHLSSSRGDVFERMTSNGRTKAIVVIMIPSLIICPKRTSKLGVSFPEEESFQGRLKPCWISIDHRRWDSVTDLRPNNLYRLATHSRTSGRRFEHKKAKLILTLTFHDAN